MTSSTPMTREELLELAALDAFGLLDDYEAALFTRSFHHAPAAVQEEVKRAQAEFASAEALLPDVTPPAELKQRVLDAVARAIEHESDELAPLATIGRTMQAPAERQARSGLFSSGQLWRAAAFALAGALAVVSYFAIETRVENRKLMEYVLGEVTVEELTQVVGHDFLAGFQGNNVRHVVLRPAAGNTAPMQAMIGVREDTNEVMLCALGLPKKTSLTLRARPATSTMPVLVHDFESRGVIEGHETGVLPRLAASQPLVWEVLDRDGVVLLTSGLA